MITLENLSAFFIGFAIVVYLMFRATGVFVLLCFVGSHFFSCGAQPSPVSVANYPFDLSVFSNAPPVFWSLLRLRWTFGRPVLPVSVSVLRSAVSAGFTGLRKRRVVQWIDLDFRDSGSKKCRA